MPEHVDFSASYDKLGQVFAYRARPLLPGGLAWCLISVILQQPQDAAPRGPK